MKDICLLVKAEFYKLFKTKTPYVLFIFIVLLIGGATYQDYSYHAKMEQLSAQNGELSSSNDWRQREENTVSYGLEMLDDSSYSPYQKDQVQRRVEVAQFRLEHDMGHDIDENGWWFFSSDSFDWVMSLILLFVVIVAVQSVAGEYQNKTINLWATLPYKRWKLLTAKLVTTISLGVMALAIVFALGALSGLLVYGIDNLFINIVLSSATGPYLMSYPLYVLIILAFKLIEITFFTALAFLIATLVKSTTFATVTALFTTIFLPPLIVMASKYYSILEWLPFNHLDFRKFIDYGRSFPVIEDLFVNVVNPAFPPLTAALVVILYLTLLLSITYYAFCRQDIH